MFKISSLKVLFSNLYTDFCTFTFPGFSPVYSYIYSIVKHLYKKNSRDLFPVTLYIFGKNEKCITFFRESGKSSGSSTLAAFNEEYSIRCFKEIYFLLGLMKYIICKNLQINLLSKSLISFLYAERAGSSGSVTPHGRNNWMCVY